MTNNHFDPKGKPPSTQTITLQNALRQSLSFEDERDFEESKKGFIAAPPYKQIMAEAGNVAWDIWAAMNFCCKALIVCSIAFIPRCSVKPFSTWTMGCRSPARQDLPGARV